MSIMGTVEWAWRGIWAHSLLLGVLALYYALALVYNAAFPIGEGPDELAHFRYARFIADEGRLPANCEERFRADYKSDWPAMYHSVVAWAWRGIDISNPPLRLVDHSTPPSDPPPGYRRPLVYHTLDDGWPYRGLVFAWHLGRLVSTLAGVGALVLCYALTLLVLPGRRVLAAGVAGVYAFTPVFTHVTATISDDGASSLFITLGLYLYLYLMLLMLLKPPSGKRRWWGPWHFAALGLFFGLAITAKYSAVVLLPTLLLLVEMGRRESLFSYGGAAARVLAFAAGAALSASWWFVYIFRHFNAVEEKGPVAGALASLSACTPDASTIAVSGALSGDALPSSFTVMERVTSLPEWVGRIFSSYWLIPYRHDAASDMVIPAVFAAVVLLAGAGLWKTARESGGAGRLRGGVWPLLAVHVLVCASLPFARHWLAGRLSETAQGRHVLFPAGAVLSLALVLGLRRWMPRRMKEWSGLIFAAALFVFNAVYLWLYVAGGFGPLLPVTSMPERAEEPSSTADARFGEFFTLRGYSVDDAGGGSLRLDTLWECTAQPDRDYFVHADVLDDDGETVAAWMGYPLGGEYRLKEWTRGDLVTSSVLMPAAREGECAGCTLRIRLFDSDGNLLSLPGGDTWAVLGAGGLRFGGGVRLDEAGVAGLDGRELSRTRDGEGAFRFGDTVALRLRWQDGQPEGGYTPFMGGPGGQLWGPDLSYGGRDNLHLFFVGPRWASGEFKPELRIGGEMVPLGETLRVQVRERAFDPPEAEHVVNADFAAYVLLYGYDLPVDSVRAGGYFPVTLYWKALQPIGTALVNFNHLADGAGEQWGGQDRLPRIHDDTTYWATGEYVGDTFRVFVDPDAPPGTYYLHVGLYVRKIEGFPTLPIMKDGAYSEETSVAIGPIEVIMK